MPINTSGFQINVMPQPQVLDPRMFATDPSKLTQGFMQATEALDAREKLKAFKEQQKEQQATRDARIAHIKAISDLAVLEANHAHAVNTAKTSAELAGFKLGEAQSSGGLQDLAPKREVESLERDLAKKTAQSGLETFAADKQLATDAKKADIEAKKAQTANWLAEAARFRAQAAGQTMSPAEETYMKKMGELASVLGVMPNQLLELSRAGTLNDEGIPLSSELSSLAENLKKPEFWKNPYESITPSLKTWLGQDGLAKLSTLAPDPTKPKGTKDEATKTEVIKIDKDGNIERSDKDKPKSAKPPSSGGGVSAANVLESAGLTGLALAGSKTAQGALSSLGSKASKLASNAWEGRSAAGRFTGQALKTLPQRSLSQFARAGAGAAALPVAAAYEANKGLGSLLSDKTTGNMTALEGIASAASQNSFDEDAANAKFDEISQRINMTINSGNLSDEQKHAELERLIDQRDILWSAMNAPKSAALPQLPLGGGFD